MKIYTKSGDAGQTGLADGSRVSKDDPRVAAYGDVDELNATLGVVLADASDPALATLLEGIQRDLFALGARLADPGGRVTARHAKTALGPERVAELEAAIDRCEADLPPLRAFVLPGGGGTGAQLHLARTVCRRAERSLVALAHAAPLDTVLVTYVNRLSDLLFVLARAANRREAKGEREW